MNKINVFKWLNRLFLILFAILIFQKIPIWLNNFKMQNASAPGIEIQRLSGENLAFPVPDQKIIFVFWASWCAPCKVELDRLNSMMSKNEIKNNELIAININESKETVQEFLKDKNYQFIIALDPNGVAAEKYKITSTPTILFINQKSEVEWLTTGLSPSLEFRVRKFLQKN